MTVAAAKKNDMTTVNAQSASGSPLINARTNAIAALKHSMISTQNAKRLEPSPSQSAAVRGNDMIAATIVGIIIAVALASLPVQEHHRAINRGINQSQKQARELSAPG